jgi:peptide/nickel transport system substrate-binding protein
MQARPHEIRSKFGRSRFRRRLLSVSALFMAASIFAMAGGGSAGAGGVSHGSAVPASKRGGTLQLGMVGITWTTLDPYASSAAVTAQPYFSMIYDQLMRQNGSVVEPDLVQSWAYSDHDLLLTLNLRHGVKFSDGTPFNAAAVAWSLTRDQTPGTCTCQAFLKPVSAVTTSGNYTVKLHLSSRDGSLLETLANSFATYIPSPAAVASEGSSFGTEPVGAGPFKVQSNEVNATLTLARNPHYWNAPLPYLSSIVVTLLASDSAGLEDVQSGSIDIEGGANAISPQVVTEAKQAGSLRVVLSPGQTWWYLNFNPKVAPFNNIVAREAIAYATDGAAIAKSLSGNLYVPTQLLDASGMVPYLGVNLKGAIKYNLAKATSLVQSIGGLSFSLLETGATPLDEALFSELQNQWSQAGIHVTLIPTATTGAFVGVLLGGRWSMLAGPWGSYTSLGANLEQIFGCNQPLNTSICDPTFDSLVTQAENTISPSGQIKLYNEAEQRLIETDVYEIPMYFAPDVRIQTKSVNGIPDSANLFFDTAWLNH